MAIDPETGRTVEELNREAVMARPVDVSVFTPEDLGAPQPPMPPAALPDFVPPSQSPHARPLGLGALIATLVGGPQSGGAAARGYLEGMKGLDAQAMKEWEFKAQQQARQDALYQRQAAQAEVATKQRQGLFLEMMDGFQKSVAASKNDDQYDANVARWSALMQQSGFRMATPTYLRQQSSQWLSPEDVKMLEPRLRDLSKTLDKQLEQDPEMWDNYKIVVQTGSGTQKGKKTISLREAYAYLGQHDPKQAQLKTVPISIRQNEDAASYYKTKVDEWVASGKALTTEVQNRIFNESVAFARKQKLDLARAGAEARQSVSSGEAGVLTGLPPRIQGQLQAQSAQFGREPVVRDTQEVANAYAFVKGLSDTTTSPADDQALIYAFAKAMDPDSAVREGEYATVQKYNQSWVATFGFNLQRILDESQTLTPKARQALKATIRSKFQSIKGNYDRVRDEYIRSMEAASRPGVGAILRDYSVGWPGLDAPGATAAPAAVTPSDRAKQELDARRKGRR